MQVSLTEGTNIAAALSPDGSTLAFDLVGRIWTMPSGGGEATPLTDPLGDARQPSWSPDGSRIVFQAYWDGNYHLWSVAADGSGLRRHTRGLYDHREPHWSPAGGRIAFSSDRGGSYDVWVLDLESGAVRQLTNAPGSEYGPAFSPGGDALAYAAAAGADGQVGPVGPDLAGSADAAPGPAGIWVIDDVESGAGSPRRIAGPGRAGPDEAAIASGDFSAPAWTADGREIVYNVIGGGRSQLLAAAASGASPGDDASGARRLSGEDEDVFPFRAAATADGFYYTGDGRIRHRMADGSGLRDVPFSGTVALDRPDYERRPRDLTRAGPFTARGIVSPAVSPDGRQVAFSALGDLWIHTIGGATERITDDPWIETDPAWSPDGSRIAFSSDRDGTLDLYVWRRDGDAFERVTDGVGAALPAWSPDGTRLAYAESAFGGGIAVVETATGLSYTIRAGFRGVGRPSWSIDGSSVTVSAHWPYSDRFREGVNRALVIPVRPLRPTAAASPGRGFGPGPAATPHWHGGHDHGGDGRGPAGLTLQVGERFLDLPALSVGTRGTDGPVRSPDGAWIAYVADGVLWTIQADENGDPSAPLARRLTNEAAADPTWTGDSRSIVYLSGTALRRVDLDSGETDDIRVEMEWERAVAPASVLVRAGALWDGRSEALRRAVDIVVSDGRIVEVADHDPARTADEVVDATDQVVIPGLIEMHMHGGITSGEQAGRVWLAYGATTVRCPACDAHEIAEARESGESGRRIGPRWFGTGGTIDGSRIYYGGAPALAGSAQVGLELATAADLGYDLVKTYVRLSDPVQARVVRAAHALGIPVTSHELYPAVAFGADGVEHVRGTSRRGYSTKVSELSRSYGDVVDLLAASGMTLTPTVGIYGAYGLLATEDPSLLDDARIDAFFPGVRGAVRAPGDLEVARRLVSDMTSLPRRVLEAGGVVVTGTDAPINPPGLSLQAEMEAMVRYGGMSALDVMRATTSVSAAALGYEGVLGTVEPGALADLVVIGGDPLTDIRATRDVRAVVQRGRVYTYERLLRRE